MLRFQDGSEFVASFQQKFTYGLISAGLGIEPKFSLSESDVLPLDDPAIFIFLYLDDPLVVDSSGLRFSKVFD